ncbi:hypothetical protein E2562_001521 [Oryza meyeriana var. granulata]|uniref:Uncharacterized protein n=1 Tax=Oryza meyeriana var. granulata TaxID=110450 RepID=A0A6G1DD56_9ORYZ|nr:hypothetical protein E2562_001521 [Oryza meyeriana var. granulata]
MSSPETVAGTSSTGSLSAGADCGGGGLLVWRQYVPPSVAPVLLLSGGRERAAQHAQQLGVAPFENGQYVRLLNRGRRGGYLFADESGEGISTDRHREMVNTVWRVQILETDTVHVVLCGAYGRHLAATPASRATAASASSPSSASSTRWRIPTASDVVLLSENPSTGVFRALRANGRYRRWNRGVTLEAIDRANACFSLMMEWEVQVIPTRVQRPPFQVGRAARRFGLWRQGSQEMQVGVGMADYNGNFNGPCGVIISFVGRSLIELGNAVERRFGDGFNFRNMSLFIRAGNLGQPFPLLTDLPRGIDDVDVIMFMVGTPGYNRLRYPDIHAA